MLIVSKRYSKMYAPVNLQSHINGLVQDCSFSSADALDTLKSCTKHRNVVDTTCLWVALNKWPDITIVRVSQHVYELLLGFHWCWVNSAPNLSPCVPQIACARVCTYVHVCMHVYLFICIKCNDGVANKPYNQPVNNELNHWLIIT